MTVRKATMEDLTEIMKVIESGRQSLAKQGSPQWQNGFGPTVEMMQADIMAQECWVGILGGEILAVASIVTGIDPVYTAITEGQWSELADDYVSIHRFAVLAERSGQGLGKSFLTKIVEIAKQAGFADIRIDTYPKNYGMIKVIEQVGFSYRGMVQFPIPDGQRVAYQLRIIRIS